MCESDHPCHGNSRDCRRMNELAERLHVMLAVDESVFVLQSINQSQGRIPAREVMAASGAVCPGCDV